MFFIYYGPLRMENSLDTVCLTFCVVQSVMTFLKSFIRPHWLIHLIPLHGKLDVGSVQRIGELHQHCRSIIDQVKERFITDQGGDGWSSPKWCVPNTSGPSTLRYVKSISELTSVSVEVE